MAKVLNSFPFRAGRHTKHPWEKWLDGRIWKLKQDEDYDCATSTIQTHAYDHARRLKTKVRTMLLDDETIIIQAIREKK